MSDEARGWQDGDWWPALGDPAAGDGMVNLIGLASTV